MKAVLSTENFYFFGKNFVLLIFIVLRFISMCVATLSYSFHRFKEFHTFLLLFTRRSSKNLNKNIFCTIFDNIFIIILFKIVLVNFYLNIYLFLLKMLDNFFLILGYFNLLYIFVINFWSNLIALTRR